MAVPRAVDPGAKGTGSKAVKRTVGNLAVSNVTAVVSPRGLPAEAEYGLSSIFYFVFAAVVFLIPVAIGAAEPQPGGHRKAACSAG